MKIIPAMDIIGGRIVRLKQGDYALETQYPEEPLDMALRIEAAGLQHLHIVDLEGARSASSSILKIVESIAKHTRLIIDFGGGIRTMQHISDVLNSGVSHVSIGSLAWKDPELFQEMITTFGSETIWLSADARNGFISVHGWTTHTDALATEWIQDQQKKGIRTVVCTDISKDGMLEGPSTNWYQDILSATNIQLIASGGIRSMEDILLLKSMGCSGAIVGKALYEGLISLEKLAEGC